MPAKQIPTTRDELLMWLCEHSDHVDEYLRTNGGLFMTYATKRVSYVFGIYDERLGSEIASAAMELLFRKSTDTRLLQITGEVEYWMYGVIKRLTLKAFHVHLQGSRHLDITDPALEDALLATPPDGPLVDSKESAHFRSLVAECLSKLTERQRQILTMRLHDPDHVPEPSDIAVSLGLSAGNVRVQLSVSREAMKECLRRKGALA